MHIHFITHELFEAPGAYEIWAKERGFTIGETEVYLNRKLPSTIDGIDLLVVMGGPQSPRTTVEECPYFDVREETAFIKKAIYAGKGVVGVCLGAQLIGESLGARVEQSPEREIGKFPIVMADFARANKKFSSFGDKLEVGHWHGDMPGLTAESKIIAYSEGCPRQIVEYSNLVYGFQCHLEFTPEVISLMIKYSQEELEKFQNSKYVQTSEILRQHDYHEMNEKLYAFLDELVDDYGAVLNLK